MSPSATNMPNTLIEALCQQLHTCISTNDGVAAPAVIVWTDPKQQWQSLVPMLLKALPELLVYGEYDPEHRSGPAIWLRCAADGTLDNLELPADSTPILYLPGIGRQDLRAGESCPDALKPLVELMYRGKLWLQRGGGDWTATAFLTSRDTLGLDIKGDNATTDAMVRALPEFATEALSRFSGRHLEADDFDQMLTTDVVRDLLLWMNDTEATRERLGEARWTAFCNQCQQQFDFSPDNDGETVAGEKLGNAEGDWKKLWQRFAEAPGNYQGIPDLLRRSKPAGLIFEPARWPDENQKEEASLRAALGEIETLQHSEACKRILELEVQHSARRDWVWAQLNQAPLAMTLRSLAMLAKHSRQAIGGQSPDDIARTYLQSGWQADAAAWRAVAQAHGTDQELIRTVVHSLLKPWADDSARTFQAAVQASALPDARHAEAVTVEAGGCIVFADGLRYDLGEALHTELERRDCRVQMNYRWAGMPTVTATAKPAVTPVADKIKGDRLPDDFSPQIASSGKAANAGELRKAMAVAGYQILTGDGMGDWPESNDSRGWTEEGKIDTRGHQLQGDLPQILEEEIQRLANRIVGLLDGGWQSVRVVTDHGWVYLPKGLPKVELPHHLTASKWARCAAIAGDSQVAVPTAPWHWNTGEYFATAPGVACFTAANCYAHGGISIQECLTPDITVQRAGGRVQHTTIDSVTWTGMRCFVVATGATAGVQADLRLQTAAGESVAAAVKMLDEDGSTSLLLADDEHESVQLVVVLLDGSGKVLAQHKTKVGND